MILNFVDMLFGCWHNNYSFPISTKSGQRRNEAARATGTYVVCLDCGKEFAYDWKQMKVVNRAPEPHANLVEAAAPLVSKQAA
jgi:hypothetical protein